MAILDRHQLRNLWLGFMTINLVSNTYSLRVRAVCLLRLGLYAYSAFPAAAGRVEDFVTAPDGTTFVGKLRIIPCAAKAVNTCVADRSFLVPIVSGYLEANLSTEPQASFFHVQYLARNQRIQWEEQWGLPVKGRSWQVTELRVNSQVPTSGDTPGSGLWIFPPNAKLPQRPECIASDEAMPQLPGTSAMAPLAEPPSTAQAGVSALTAITEGDVTGLIPDLKVRAVMGPGFSNSRTAIINDTGQIEGAVGSTSDCMHVDGTSAACGGSTFNFVDGESPGGVVDGSNMSFTLANTPLPATSLHLFRNGLMQKLGFDYTFSGSTIVFVTIATPQPGDTILAEYRH